MIEHVSYYGTVHTVRFRQETGTLSTTNCRALASIKQEAAKEVKMAQRNHAVLLKRGEKGRVMEVVDNIVRN